LEISYVIVVEKHLSETLLSGNIIALGAEVADVQSHRLVRKWTNLKVSFFDPVHRVTAHELYAKVTQILSASPPTFRIRFTSVTEETQALLHQLCAGCAG
jgi:hypothetical protein